MSDQAVIDGLEFARAGQALEGTLPVAKLGRLADCLFDTDGSIAFRIRGAWDEERRPILVVEASGLLHLQCQRCLEMLEYPLGVSNVLLLVRPGEDVSANAEDPEAPDCIDAGPEMDVPALLEDEILLSLPFAPRHDEGSCRSAVAAGQGESGRPPGAFSALAGLKNLRP